MSKKINYKEKLYLSLSALTALIYSLPYLIKWNYIGIRDWDLFTTIAGVPLSSLVDYGQFPFWNPYLSGGNILFHHPEVLVLSPFYLLYMIFGEVAGLKLQILICYFLGFYGSYKLFAKLGISSFGAYLGAVVYFGSVHFALHFSEGHIPFTHFCFMPWFIYYILKASKKRLYIIPASLAIALMILGNGAAVPLLYTMTLSAMLFLLLSIQQKKLRLFLDFIYSAIGGIALSAVKFIPMTVYLFQNRWWGNSDESIPFSALDEIFFGLNHSLFVKNFSEQFWNWHEYGAYLSPLLIILALWALVNKFNKFWPYLVTLLFFLMMGLGNYGSFSIWSLLNYLPGFSSLRCTGRSFQLVIFVFAILGGFGFDMLRDRLSNFGQKWLSYLPYIIAVVIIATNLYLVLPINSSAFVEKLPAIERSEQFRHVIDQKPQAYKNFKANKG